MGMDSAQVQWRHLRSTAERLTTVKAEIDKACSENGRESGSVRLIAVSKTFSADDIRPALAAGHRDFGENRVQEAEGKWPELQGAFPDVRLHLIGPLQTNKVRDAVSLFDVIHSVDREKLAMAIAKEQERQGRRPETFIQVNTGSEPQKAGVEPGHTNELLGRCRDLGLNVCGLMCIPPVEEEPALHFALLHKLAVECGLERLSMGMSGDYVTAIAFGATDVRVGSAIFGTRTPIG